MASADDIASTVIAYVGNPVSIFALMNSENVERRLGINNQREIQTQQNSNYKFPVDISLS